MSRKKTYEEFLTEAIAVHGNKFQYDETTYVDTHTKMKIICPKHGEFWQTPKGHLLFDCERCSYEMRGQMFRSNTNEFIEKARKVHGDKYDYSKTEYKTAKGKVVITCPIHGDFLQVPNYHLNGRGCPVCNNSRLEMKVMLFLNDKNIKYIYQYHNDNLGKQTLDFYLPEQNLGVECQGKQHLGFGGWSENFNFSELYDRDVKKNKICSETGIKLIYIYDDKYLIPESLEIYNKENTFSFEEFKKLLL